MATSSQFDDGLSSPESEDTQLKTAASIPLNDTESELESLDGNQPRPDVRPKKRKQKPANPTFVGAGRGCGILDPEQLRRQQGMIAETYNQDQQEQQDEQDEEDDDETDFEERRTRNTAEARRAYVAAHVSIIANDFNLCLMILIDLVIYSFIHLSLVQLFDNFLS